MLNKTNLKKTHKTLGWTSLDEGSPRRTDLHLHNTQNSQEKDIHVSGGIRTRNPSKSTAADPRLRSRGHWVVCPRSSDTIVLSSLSYHNSLGIIIFSSHLSEQLYRHNYHILETSAWTSIRGIPGSASYWWPKNSVCSLISEILLINGNLLIALFVRGTSH